MRGSTKGESIKEIADLFSWCSPERVGQTAGHSAGCHDAVRHTRDSSACPAVHFHNTSLKCERHFPAIQLRTQ